MHNTVDCLTKWNQNGNALKPKRRELYFGCVNCRSEVYPPLRDGFSQMNPNREPTVSAFAQMFQVDVPTRVYRDTTLANNQLGVGTTVSGRFKMLRSILCKVHKKRKNKNGTEQTDVRIGTGWKVFLLENMISASA